VYNKPQTAKAEAKAKNEGSVVFVIADDFLCCHFIITG
jgi:hypothetical protein